jgi:hypothetical protein
MPQFVNRYCEKLRGSGKTWIFSHTPGGGWELLDTMSRPALGPTQPPVQGVSGVISLGIKRSEREADRSPPSSVGVKEFVEPHLHSHNTSSWRRA